RCGGQQPAVEVDAPGFVGDLVLVAAATRDLDDHGDAAFTGGLRHSCQCTGNWPVYGEPRRIASEPMEFRRIENLPPYVFSIINGLKIEARRAGADVVDLGFGNPDIPSPDIAVEKLAEAARNPKNHRYSLS